MICSIITSNSAQILHHWKWFNFNWGLLSIRLPTLKTTLFDVPRLREFICQNVDSTAVDPATHALVFICFCCDSPSPLRRRRAQQNKRHFSLSAPFRTSYSHVFKRKSGDGDIVIIESLDSQTCLTAASRHLPPPAASLLTLISLHLFSSVTLSFPLLASLCPPFLPPDTLLRKRVCVVQVS